MAEKSGASEYVIGSKKPTQAELDGALKDILNTQKADSQINQNNALNEELNMSDKAAKSRDFKPNPISVLEQDEVNEEPSQKAAKLNSIIKAADGLSLGISMVVAVLIGVGLGILLAKLYKPLFWLGVAFGVAAAINNVYKAYKRLLDE